MFIKIPSVGVVSTLVRNVDLSYAGRSSKLGPELASQYILQKYDNQSKFQFLQFTYINKNDLTSKYTVFAFLYAVLAPKTNKKVVLKKNVSGPN